MWYTSFKFVVSLLTPSRLRDEFERSLVYPPVGAVLGGWLGAIPIALDWDRPWQVSDHSYQKFRRV